MAPGSSSITEQGAWSHPDPTVCDGACAPASNDRELWHHREPQPATLGLNHDKISGVPFRDDKISTAGIQTAGEVCWRLQLNDEVVEASLADMERVLSSQLEHVREVMSALTRVPRPRPA